MTTLMIIGTKMPSGMATVAWKTMPASVGVQETK